MPSETFPSRGKFDAISSGRISESGLFGARTAEEGYRRLLGCGSLKPAGIAILLRDLHIFHGQRKRIPDPPFELNCSLNLTLGVMLRDLFDGSRFFFPFLSPPFFSLIFWKT